MILHSVEQAFAHGVDLSHSSKFPEKCTKQDGRNRFAILPVFFWTWGTPQLKSRSCSPRQSVAKTGQKKSPPRKEGASWILVPSSWCSCFVSRDRLTQSAVTEPVTDLQITICATTCLCCFLFGSVQSTSMCLKARNSSVSSVIQQILCTQGSCKCSKLCLGFHCSRAVILIAPFHSVFRMSS